MKNKFYVTFRLKHLIIMFFLFLSLLSVVMFFGAEHNSISVMSEAEATENPLIIIDAGHGGEDGGTQSSSGILEKDVNLVISKKLNILLRSLGFETLMLRQEDKMLYGDNCTTQREKKVSDIHNRMEIINEHPEGILLSIHQNYYSESKYTGAQVFYSPNNTESSLLAQLIQNNISSAVQPDNTRKIKKSGTEIYLLYHAQNPAIMIECGFLSNPGEALLLSDNEYQKKMCLAITVGLCEYLKGKN